MAFNQGAAVPDIACFNKATTPLGIDFDKLLAALQEYVTVHIAPVWATPAKLVKTNGFIAGSWAMVFTDDADQANALAYHDLTPDGLPVSKVFVRTIAASGEQLSVAASHELVEMLVDPAINLMTTGPDARTCYAYETADPVEALSFPSSQGVPLSDFVFPSYFELFHTRQSVPFDKMGKVTKPFEILAGGYQILFRGGRWTQIFGSNEKRMAFRKEDRRGHRAEMRKRSRSLVLSKPEQVI